LDPATMMIWIAAVVLIVIGILGLVLPALPGAPLVFLGALLAAWAEDFAYLGTGSLVLLGVLAVLAVVIDFIASAYGVRRYGASGRAMLGAAVGAIAGLPFGIAGVLLGPFIGATLGELSLRRSLGAASRAGIGATIGLVLGTAAKLAIAVAMVGVIVVMRLL
jgi:uncharacterized protein YqgC (DUF456 family)